MDASKFYGTSIGANSAGDLIRKVSMEDVEAILILAAKTYGAINLAYARAFIVGNMVNSDILMLCTDKAFGCCYIHDYPFLHNTRCGTMEFLAAEEGCGWDAYFILKKMIEWSHEKGAGEFSMRSKTNVSLAPFAKRLGFEPEPLGYSLELNRVLH